MLALPWRGSVVQRDFLRFTSPLQLQVTAHDLSTIANKNCLETSILIQWFQENQVQQ